MKFTRRPDLAPQTRIDIVMLAWLHQGIYGKMTQIANYYRISRAFLSQLLLAANLQLEVLFSDIATKLIFRPLILLALWRTLLPVSGACMRVRIPNASHKRNENSGSSWQSSFQVPRSQKLT